MKLSQTTFAYKIGCSEQAEQAVKTLMGHGKDAILSPQERERLFGVVNYSNTPIKSIATEIITGPHIDSYCLIAPRSSSEITELLTGNYYVIDTYEEPKLRSLVEHTPELRGKAIINVAPYTTRERDMTLKLKDVFQFHAELAKAFFVLRWNDRNYRMSPALQRFVVESYSIVTSNVLARRKNLQEDHWTIKVLIAYYYARLLNSDPKNAKAIVQSLDFLGSPAATLDLVESEEVQDLYNSARRIDVGLLCATIRAKGTTRLETFSVDDYIPALQSITQSIVHTNIAHEYPPYWVYSLFAALSNQKISLTNHLQSNKMKEKAMKFATTFIQSQDFKRDLER